VRATGLYRFHMTKIFISYHRQDTLGIEGRIFDRLTAKFGGERVFMDIGSIPFGVDFHGWLDDEVGRAAVALAHPSGLEEDGVAPGFRRRAGHGGCPGGGIHDGLA